MHGSPELQRIALAVALVTVVAAAGYINREYTAALVRGAMDWTRSAQLIPRAAAWLEAELAKYLFDGDLRAEPMEVNARHWDRTC